MQLEPPLLGLLRIVPAPITVNVEDTALVWGAISLQAVIWTGYLGIRADDAMDDETVPSRLWLAAYSLQGFARVADENPLTGQLRRPFREPFPGTLYYTNL